MIPFSQRKVPALLKAKVSIQDEVSITITRESKTGFMVKDEYYTDLGKSTTKIFPSESAAKSYASGQEIIKVDVKWVP